MYLSDSTGSTKVAKSRQYAEILYGVKPQGEEAPAEDDEEEDIEASLKRELDAMKATGKEAKAAGRIFTPVKMNVACLLFVRTRSPVEPVPFVKRICQDAKSGEQRTRSRYVNRLVPMTAVGKATEQGLVELARKVLGEEFDLSGKRTDDDATAVGTDHGDAKESGAQGTDDGTVEKNGSDGPAPCSVCVNCEKKISESRANILTPWNSSLSAQASATTTRSNGTSSSRKSPA